jgi:hypothetical protein
MEGKQYDGFIPGSKIVFDGASSLHVLAVQNGEVLLVELEIIDRL